MSRSLDIAKILRATELTNPNNERLLTLGETPSGGLDSASVQSVPLVTYYSTLDSLPTYGTLGAQAFVNSNRKHYISDGVGWYNTTYNVSAAPYWVTEPSSTYEIADSATPLVITALALDSDNPTLVNQSFGTDSAQYMVTVTNDSSVFTFTPKSVDSISTEVAAGNLTDSNGDFVYTFKWSDGTSFVSKAVTITYNTAAPGFGRAIFSGGTTGSGGTTTIEYFDFATGGATTSFGSMSTNRGGHASFSNAGRAVFANGETSGSNTYASSMEYVTPSTTGNAAYFGNNDVGKAFMGAVADLTRGVIGGGSYYSGGWNFRERMDYVAIDTTGNSSYFGSLSWAWSAEGAASSGDNTYGLWGGGVRTSDTQYVGYYHRMTIQTLGSASSHGSWSNSYARGYTAGFADQTYSWFGGGINNSSNPSYHDSIDKHAIATGGTATNIGNLSAAKYSLAGCQDATHGMFAGGYASYMHGNIEQLNMSNDNINSSFGSLSAGARYRHDATSGSS